MTCLFNRSRNFLYVWYMYVYTFTRICVWECTRVWRLEIHVKCLPQLLFTLFVEIGSLVEFGVHWSS